MKTKKFSILLTILILFNVFAFSATTKKRANQSYKQAVDKYVKYKKFASKDKSLDAMLRSALNYIRKSREALRRNNYSNALRFANRANDILISIGKKIQSGDFAISKRRSMDKLMYIRHVWTLMKRYNLRSSKILNLFAEAKNKMKFARMLIRENRLRKANNLLKNALDELNKIPDIYEKELAKETKAQMEIFRAQVMAEFTLVYYVKENETQGEFRKVRHHLLKARQRYKMMDYKGVRRHVNKVHKEIKGVQELKKKIDRENKKRFKKCMDANYAIIYANSIRKRNSQELKKGATYDTFYLARRRLKKAQLLLKQGRCDQAYKTASKAITLFVKLRKMRRTLISNRNQAETLLVRARNLLEKAKKIRLPFDAEQQIKDARSNINDANDFIKSAAYEMAISKLKPTIMKLRALIR